MANESRRTNYTKELTEADHRRREGGWSATPIGRAASSDRVRSSNARKRKPRTTMLSERRRLFEVYAKMLEEMAE